MIAAAKNPLGAWALWQLVRSSVRRQFNAVHLRVATDGPDTTPAPTIYYVNHSAWWDGYLSLVLEHQALHHDPYLMMEDRNLRRYRFFTWAGAFGVDRDDPRAALQSLEYAATLLRDHPDRAVYVFPQGTLEPNDRRPFHLYSGLARLALRVGVVRLVPVALRYEFMQEQHPDAFINVGGALLITPQQSPTPRALTAQLTAALTATVDALHSDVTGEHFDDYTTILEGRGGIDRRFDRFMFRKRRQSRRLSREAEARHQLEP